MLLRRSTILKETPTQVFSCEYYEIFKAPFFIKHLWMFAYIPLNTSTIVTKGERRDCLTLLCRQQKLSLFFH